MQFVLLHVVIFVNTLANHVDCIKTNPAAPTLSTPADGKMYVATSVSVRFSWVISCIGGVVDF